MTTQQQDETRIQRLLDEAEETQRDCIEKLNSWRDYRWPDHQSPEEWAAHRLRVSKRLWLLLKSTAAVIHCLNAITLGTKRELTSDETYAEIRKLLDEGEQAIRLGFSGPMGSDIVQ